MEEQLVSHGVQEQLGAQLEGEQVAEAPHGKQDAPELELELEGVHRRVEALEGPGARVELGAGGGHRPDPLVRDWGRSEQGAELGNAKCPGAREETADFLEL